MARFSFLTERPVRRHSLLDTPGFVGVFRGSISTAGPYGYVLAATKKAARAGAERQAKLHPRGAQIGEPFWTWSCELMWFAAQCSVTPERYRDDY